MATYSKNEQLLAYLIKKRPKASVTVLMKLCYFIDLISAKNNKIKISDFNYIRYYYGPFDSTINDNLQRLMESKNIIPSYEYRDSGEEYIVYDYNEDGDMAFDDLDGEALKIIDSAVEKLKGYSARTLIEIAYKTEPMVKLGATINGHENLNVALVL